MSDLQVVDLENGVVNVELFSKTEESLAGLAEKYDVVPDAETEEGYEFCKAGAKELRTLRVAVEDKRKEIKEPFLEAGKIIDKSAKTIIERLRELEEPLKLAHREIDERERKAKEERERRLDQKIQNIIDYREKSTTASSEQISIYLEELDNMDMEDFYEKSVEAIKARNRTIEILGELYDQRVEAERQAEENQKLHRESYLNDKLNKIAMLPTKMKGASAEELEVKAKELLAIDPKDERYGEKGQDFFDLGQSIAAQLHKMAEEASATSQAKEEPEDKDGSVELEEIAAVEIPAKGNYLDEVKRAVEEIGESGVFDVEIIVSRVEL